MNHKTQKSQLLLVLLITSAICIWTVSCRPNDRTPGATNANEEREEGYEDLSDQDYQRIKPCIQNMTVMELCMRCAKVTKSPIVYPMCCSNEDRVTDWCTEYIYYGRTT